MGIVAAEHGLRPELDPLTHQISEYAKGPAAGVGVAGFLAWAMSLGATGRLARRATSSRALAILFALAAVGMLAVACFATQTVAGSVPPGERMTPTGRLHDVGSGVATLAILCAALASLSRVELRRIRALTIGLTASAVAINVALLAVGQEVGGLRQRLLVLAACLWQAAFLVAIARAARGCEHPPGEDGAPSVRPSRLRSIPTQGEG